MHTQSNLWSTKTLFWCHFSAGDKVSDKGLFNNPQRLGVSGLALHYANIISQIDNIVSIKIVLSFSMF